MRLRCLGGTCAALLVAMTAAGGAHASSGIDSPENGVLQLGRGSAWIARADDPLAVYFNPAGLSQQSSGVHVGAHFMLMDRCFTRLGPDGKPVSPGNDLPGPGAEGGPAASVCKEKHLFPNPQLAATFRLTNDLAVGLAVVGPHAVGDSIWPESIPFTNKFGVATTQPAPQRYMLVTSASTILLPTLSVSYAVNEAISVGLGFVWGIASVEFVNFTEGTSPPPGPGETAVDEYDKHLDVKATLGSKDLFIPGVVVGGLWSATKNLDVGAWFKWIDAVRSKADLRAESLYWKAGGQKNDDPCLLTNSDTTDDLGANCNITDAPEAGDLLFRLPMEAKLGVRFHYPRSGDALEKPGWAKKEGKRVRDAMSEDLFDVELDFTWAHNSVLDNLELRFKPGIGIAGTPGAAPENSDVAHKWKDVFGVRLGGDFVALPNRLAVRAGAFYESKGQDDEYLNIDFHLGDRVGLSGGATLRVWQVDISAAYQHTFFGALDNGGRGALKAISGDKSSNFRSQQAINGGRLETSLDEFAFAGTVHF